MVRKWLARLYAIQLLPHAMSIVDRLRRLVPAGLLLLAAGVAHADEDPVEVHQVLVVPPGGGKIVALTLDACSGGYDRDLVTYLVEHRIPATIFVTRRWLQRQPAAVAELKAHPDLFDIEDHGDRHVPAVIGAGRAVYGIPGNSDVDHLKREVAGGARAITAATGTAPTWYRSATGEYDPAALAVIAQMGYHVAGFSLNADAGATLPRKQILERIARAKSGDIIIAHLNRPASDTAEALAEGLQRLLDQGYRFVTLRDATVQYTPDTLRRLTRTAAHL